MTSLDPALTEFQLDVARTFFDLPGNAGFLLAGGAGLVASGLTTRPTLDLDFFTSTPSVTEAYEQLERAATARGRATRRVRDHADFVRLTIVGPEDLLVDLALDSPPVRPSVVTIAGPTLGPDDLAGRKVVALFSRAEARDFADVSALLARYSSGALLDLAREISGGFDQADFVQMLRTIDRFDDDTLRAAGADPAAIRSTIREWASELSRNSWSTG